jgi:hypothetical protein
LRFISLTIASLSSCVPAPTCEPAPAGPHCFGGGALTDVRRPCPGLRLRALPESLGAPSLAMTVAAMPWIVDPRFPHSPDNVATGDFGVDVPEDLWKDDEGVQVASRRDEEAAPEYTFGAGDPFLEPILDVPLLCPLSLPSAE